MAWSEGHRFWCSVKDVEEDIGSIMVHGNPAGAAGSGAVGVVGCLGDHICKCRYSSEIKTIMEICQVIISLWINIVMGVSRSMSTSSSNGNISEFDS